MSIEFVGFLIIVEALALLVLGAFGLYWLKIAKALQNECVKFDIELRAIRAAALGNAWTMDSRSWSRNVRVVAELRDRYEKLLG